MSAAMESVVAAAIAMLALGSTADAPNRHIPNRPAPAVTQVAQAAPAAGSVQPAVPPPGSPAAPTAVEQAVKEAFAGVVVHEDGTVETTDGPGLAAEDGLPPGLAREVRNSNRLPRALQERLTQKIQARHPQAEVEYDGVAVTVRDKAGKEIESIKDVVELARVMNRPPQP